MYEYIFDNTFKDSKDIYYFISSCYQFVASYYKMENTLIINVTHNGVDDKVLHQINIVYNEKKAVVITNHISENNKEYNDICVNMYDLCVVLNIHKLIDELVVEFEFWMCQKVIPLNYLSKIYALITSTINV